MKIESIYPLTPLQQGMLFHSLLDPGAGVYWTQLCFVLEGDVDAALFRLVWQDTCARHPAMRTVFVWEKRERPLQAVLESLPLPWTQLDWTDAPAAEQDARFENFLAEDRRSPCDLARGPLMRVALIRLGPQRYRCVWSSHHILMDGWSGPIVLGELFARYEAAARRETFDPPTARPFKDYVEWLVKQDGDARRQFFTPYLAGFAPPTP